MQLKLNGFDFSHQNKHSCFIANFLLIIFVSQKTEFETRVEDVQQEASSRLEMEVLGHNSLSMQVCVREQTNYHTGPNFLFVQVVKKAKEVAEQKEVELEFARQTLQANEVTRKQLEVSFSANTIGLRRFRKNKLIPCVLFCVVCCMLL
jgi:hypothetical protein